MCYVNNNLSKCAKVNPAGVRSAEISNGYPDGRYFDISVQQLDGKSSATLNVNKDTVKVSTYKNGAWTDVYTLATKSDLSNKASYDSVVTDLNSPPTTVIIRTDSDPTGYPTNLGGNSCLAFQLNPGTKYSAQLAFSFSKDRLAIRRKYNSDTWTAWKYVDFTIS